MDKKINVVKNVLDANDAIAAENRRLLENAGALLINILSAPGSGKTTLMEKTFPALTERGLTSAMVVGDLQTSRDAERIGATGADVIQINTEGGCHLSATQVATALQQMDLAGLAFLFIENVGNMVCPAGFDLGEHHRVAMLSTPEGQDKVAKYNTLFLSADLVVLNKMDLADVLGFDKSQVYEDLSKVNTRAKVIEISAATEEGIDQWIDWLLALQSAK